MANTTADLIEDVNVSGSLPVTNGLVSPTQLLRMADRRLRTDIADLMKTARAEYWLESADHTIVAGTAGYRIPDRALASGLRDVIVRDPQGTEWELTQRPQTDRHLFANGVRRTWYAPFAFIFENGKVLLAPTPDASHAGWTLRLRYYARPPQLIATTAGARIAAPLSSSAVTLGTAPASTISTAGAYVDIVRGDGMHEAIDSDRRTAAYNAGTFELSFSNAISNGEIATSTTQNERADYVVPRGQNVYVPVPEAVYPVLVAGTLIEALEAIGDHRSAALAIETHRRKRAEALSQLVPRADGALQRAIPRYSALRGG